MTRAGTLFLAELGAKVLGTDALGWDRPFMEMRRAFQESGDGERDLGRSLRWARPRGLHRATDGEPGLGADSSGFKVGFFPLALAGLSASPARVVAFV